MHYGNKAPILLAESDADDVFLLKRAFQRTGVSNPLTVVRDGQAAIDYLKGDGIYADRKQYPLPGLLLLDLKMPLVDGLQVLEWVHGQAHLHDLPIIVLSGSASQSELQRAMNLGAVGYQLKPQTFDGLLDFTEKLRHRWLERPGVSPR